MSVQHISDEGVTSIPTQAQPSFYDEVMKDLGIDPEALSPPWTLEECKARADKFQASVPKKGVKRDGKVQGR